ncbi:MAG: type II secretion system F family protein [bacterium]
MKRKIFIKKLNARAQARFARRCATFLGGGISLPDTLGFIARSIPDKNKLHQIYIVMIGAVNTGQSFSTALAASQLFDSAFVHLVRIGESSGSLEEALIQIAATLERRDELSKKLTSVMIYPAFISAATLGIALFLILYIFPKIIPLVTSMGIPLPLLTRILLSIQAALTHHWLMIMLCCAGAISLLTLFWKMSARFREYIRAILFLLPIVGRMLRAMAVISIFKPLGLLLDRGEVLPVALSSVRDGLPYSEFKRIVDNSIFLVTRGGKLSEAFTSMRHIVFRRTIFDSIIIDLLETGERTGSVAHACENIARIYESELDETIDRISRVIEPLLMLGMGGVVGSIALSIIMPIYEITNHLSR